MKLIRIAFVCSISMVLAVSLYAQNPELTLAEGVKAHVGVDRIYADFSKSYRTLDPKLLASLYTEDGSYLTPNRNIISGRSEILNSFKGFFERIKDRNRTMTIAFQIVSRKVNKRMGYDVGTFLIEYSEKGKVVGKGTGKFVVVTERGKDGKWRFAVDGYSPLQPDGQ
ncbi:MAG: DUF4440 domain-containing protein [Pyrinomonadaceae bacterium]|nr:DUF4440 domain-containing protein [Pyrinomonadaceae bacterium]